MHHRNNRRGKGRRHAGAKKKKYRGRNVGLSRFAPAWYAPYGGAGAARPEKKFLDVDIANASVSATLEMLPDIVTVAAGTGESQRVGRKIVVTDIYIRGCPVFNESNVHTVGGDCFRLIVVLDKQCNGAEATALTLLQTNAPESYRNVENFARYDFLVDKYFSVNCTAGAYDGTVAEFADHRGAMYRKHIRCQIPIEFSSTTGAITERATNNISIWMISQQAASGFTPAVCRIRYIG